MGWPPTSTTDRLWIWLRVTASVSDGPSVIDPSALMRAMPMVAVAESAVKTKLLPFASVTALIAWTSSKPLPAPDCDRNPSRAA